MLDEWFHQDVLPRLRGKATLVRYSDDFVIIFEQEDDARKVMDVLPKRFDKYGLKLHPEKTRLVPFRCPPPTRMGDASGTESESGTFDFLGSTHRWALSVKKNWVVMLKTAVSRLRRSVKKIAAWCRDHRHCPVRERWKALKQKLLGHYAYFEVAGNHRALIALSTIAYAPWRSWLDRRSQRARVTWAKMRVIHAHYPLPHPPQPLKQLRG